MGKSEQEILSRIRQNEDKINYLWMQFNNFESVELAEIFRRLRILEQYTSGLQNEGLNRYLFRSIMTLVYEMKQIQGLSTLPLKELKDPMNAFLIQVSPQFVYGYEKLGKVSLPMGEDPKDEEKFDSTTLRQLVQIPIISGSSISNLDGSVVIKADDNYIELNGQNLFNSELEYDMDYVEVNHMIKSTFGKNKEFQKKYELFRHKKVDNMTHIFPNKTVTFKRNKKEDKNKMKITIRTDEILLKYDLDKWYYLQVKVQLSNAKGLVDNSEWHELKIAKPYVEGSVITLELLENNQEIPVDQVFEAFINVNINNQVRRGINEAIKRIRDNMRQSTSAGLSLTAGIQALSKIKELTDKTVVLETVRYEFDVALTGIDTSFVRPKLINPGSVMLTGPSVKESQYGIFDTQQMVMFPLAQSEFNPLGNFINVINYDLQVLPNPPLIQVGENAYNLLPYMDYQSFSTPVTIKRIIDGEDRGALFYYEVLIDPTETVGLVAGGFSLDPLDLTMCKVMPNVGMSHDDLKIKWDHQTPETGGEATWGWWTDPQSAEDLEMKREVVITGWYTQFEKEVEVKLGALGFADVNVYIRMYVEDTNLIPIENSFEMGLKVNDVPNTVVFKSAEWSKDSEQKFGYISDLVLCGQGKAKLGFTVDGYTVKTQDPIVAPINVIQTSPTNSNADRCVQTTLNLIDAANAYSRAMGTDHTFAALDGFGIGMPIAYCDTVKAKFKHEAVSLKDNSKNNDSAPSNYVEYAYTKIGGQAPYWNYILKTEIDRYWDYEQIDVNGTNLMLTTIESNLNSVALPLNAGWQCKTEKILVDIQSTQDVEVKELVLPKNINFGADLPNDLLDSKSLYNYLKNLAKQESLLIHNLDVRIDALSKAVTNIVEYLNKEHEPNVMQTLASIFMMAVDVVAPISAIASVIICIAADMLSEINNITTTGTLSAEQAVSIYIGILTLGYMMHSRRQKSFLEGNNTTSDVGFNTDLTNDDIKDVIKNYEDLLSNVDSPVKYKESTGSYSRDGIRTNDPLPPGDYNSAGFGSESTDIGTQTQGLESKCRCVNHTEVTVQYILEPQERKRITGSTSEISTQTPIRVDASTMTDLFPEEKIARSEYESVSSNFKYKVTHNEGRPVEYEWEMDINAVVKDTDTGRLKNVTKTIEEGDFYKVFKDYAKAANVSPYKLYVKDLALRQKAGLEQKPSFAMVPANVLNAWAGINGHGNVSDVNTFGQRKLQNQFFNIAYQRDSVGQMFEFFNDHFDLSNQQEVDIVEYDSDRFNKKMKYYVTK